MRLAFAGTPAFAATALDRLIAERFDLALVLTQPDRPAGRGQQLAASMVKQRALAHGLSIVQPRGLKLDGRYADDAQATQAALRAARVDAMVVVAYGLILPPWVLALPRLGCLNIHGSLLPRWRGAAPIQRAIEAGDTRTGITIIRMDEGLDTGPMLACAGDAIRADDTAASLHDRLAPLGAALMADVLSQARAGHAWTQRVQPDEGVTYAHKIEKQEAAIDWREPATVIERRLRAFDPFPGCTFEFEGQTVKLWRAACAPARARAAAGTFDVWSEGITVTCGEDALELLEVQKAGGRRTAIAPFVQGLRR